MDSRHRVYYLVNLNQCIEEFQDFMLMRTAEKEA